MMRNTDAGEAEVDLRAAGDGEEEDGAQSWKTPLETVLEEEEEEEEDAASTQSDTRPLIDQRDPRQIHQCLKVSFEDVIAEPETVRSGDRVWIWSHALFELSRVWSYRIITALLAVPIALIAGVLFALLSFIHIWLLTPCLQMFSINTGWIQRLWSSVLDTFIRPFSQSLAKSCSRIHLRLARA